MDITEILDKAIRVADQVLIGEGRASRAINVGLKVVNAAAKELTGEQEQAILTRLSVLGTKLMEIVGDRPA